MQWCIDPPGPHDLTVGCSYRCDKASSDHQSLVWLHLSVMLAVGRGETGLKLEGGEHTKSTLLWSIDSSRATEHQCGLYLNDSLTTRIWQESVCHLLTQKTCLQHGLFPKSLNRNKLLSSQRSKCPFKDDALKIVLPGRAVRRLKTFLLVRSSVPALVARTVDRWQRNCFHQSWERPLSWRELTFDLLHHTVCRSLRRVQLGHGLGPKLIIRL